VRVFRKGVGAHSGTRKKFSPLRGEKWGGVCGTAQNEKGVQQGGGGQSFPFRFRINVKTREKARPGWVGGTVQVLHVAKNQRAPGV